MNENIDAEISKLEKKIDSLESENERLEPDSDREFNNPPGLRMPATEKIARNNDEIEKHKISIAALKNKKGSK